MTIVCIVGDKFGYFPPRLPALVSSPICNSTVSFGNPATMRVPALFDLFGGGVSPLRNKSKRESGVYISNNTSGRMAIGFPKETGLSPLWCKKEIA